MYPLALYLPQYHRIKENDLWWGEGYTEWDAVRKAIKYSKKQRQPRIPMDKNYYDLSDESATTWKWQADLARTYGIYGFVIYHYWFRTGKQLLERPMEILLNHPEIDIKYSICWANESWRRAWYGTHNELLINQEYGDKKEWENHFHYLLKFLKDDRYIKIDGKPMINIYHTSEVKCIEKMLSLWNSMAQENGFDGLYIVAANSGAPIDYRTHIFDAYYNFEPSYSLMHKRSKSERLLYGVDMVTRSTANKIFRKKIIERSIDGNKFINIMLRNDAIKDKIVYPGVFPQWDNTPRRKYKGTFFDNMTPEAFKRQILGIKRKYKESDFLYINAWNEWGEGAYLEPDEDVGYKYLEVISDEFQN